VSRIEDPMSGQTILFIALFACVLPFLVHWVRLARGRAPARVRAPGAAATANGFVTNFFDTLGIGARLALGLAGNFALGALMTLGIGLYAPCLILVSLLGMSPVTAFPIMMGSCAFLMPVGSVRFLRAGSYDLRAAIGLTVGGIPAVLIAAYLVKSLPLDAVRWLVVVVVIYTAGMMLRSAAREGRAAARDRAPAAGN
jgi:hypothetical protein